MTLIKKFNRNTIYIILGCVMITVIGYPSIYGGFLLLCDLVNFGFNETCTMCIRALQNIASTTGYSYGFWNVLFFIIIEPLLFFILLFTTFIKSHKVRNIIAGITAIMGLIMLNFLMEHYALCSKSLELVSLLQASLSTPH